MIWDTLKWKVRLRSKYATVTCPCTISIRTLATASREDRINRKAFYRKSHVNCLFCCSNVICLYHTRCHKAFILGRKQGLIFSIVERIYSHSHFQVGWRSFSLESFFLLIDIIFVFKFIVSLHYMSIQHWATRIINKNNLFLTPCTKVRSIWYYGIGCQLKKKLYNTNIDKKKRLSHDNIGA